MTEIRSCILSQYLWYSKSIEVDKASVLFLKFFEKKKKRREFKREYNLHESSCFKWIQLIDSRKVEIYYQRKLKMLLT